MSALTEAISPGRVLGRHVEVAAMTISSEASALVRAPLPSADASEDPGPDETTSLAGEVLRRRWDLVLPYREEMLKIALRRTQSREDAEDVVATALLRTVQFDGLDERRVGAFLCTTVIRLAVDVHRQRERQAAVALRHGCRAEVDRTVEEIVCDRAEAKWLSDVMAELPPRERQVLEARLQGVTAQGTSGRLGISPKSAENAYTRVRQRAHSLLSATLAGIGILIGTGKRVGKSAAVAVPVAALAALGLTLGIKAPPPAAVVEPTLTAQEEVERRVLPQSQRPHPTAPRPSRSNVALSTALDLPLKKNDPERTELKPPPLVSRDLADAGGVYVEKRREESFAESVQRCLDGVAVADPTADPCR